VKSSNLRNTAYLHLEEFSGLRQYGSPKKIQNRTRDTETKRWKLLLDDGFRRGVESALGFSVLALLVGSLGRRIVLQAILKAANAFRETLAEFRQFPRPEQKQSDERNQ
jgi:hypothetical protein